MNNPIGLITLVLGLAWIGSFARFYFMAKAELRKPMDDLQ